MKRDPPYQTKTKKEKKNLQVLFDKIMLPAPHRGNQCQGVCVRVVSRSSVLTAQVAMLMRQ